MTDDLLKRLGPSVTPFERRNAGNPDSLPVYASESEKIKLTEFIIEITSANDLAKLKLVEIDPIFADFPFDKKYLWIIDKNGFKVIPEATLNPFAGKDDRKVVCHTNITGGAEALQGGEVWFSTNKEAVINFKSGRYGANEPHQVEAILEFFTLLGFTVFLSSRRL